jgi:hypothetical protein
LSDQRYDILINILPLTASRLELITIQQGKPRGKGGASLS